MYSSAVVELCPKTQFISYHLYPITHMCLSLYALVYVQQTLHPDNLGKIHNAPQSVLIRNVLLIRITFNSISPVSSGNVVYDLPEFITCCHCIDYKIILSNTLTLTKPLNSN